MKTMLRFGMLSAGLAALALAPMACYVDQTAAPGDRPYLVSLSPSSVVAGSAGFTITVNGYGLQATDVISWQGAPKTTTFVSAAQVTARIDSVDILSPGVAQVAVYRPAEFVPLHDELYLVIKSRTP